VMQAARTEARNSTASAMSAGSTNRPSGDSLANSCPTSSTVSPLELTCVASNRSRRSPGIGPGEIKFTRTPASRETGSGAAKGSGCVPSRPREGTDARLGERERPADVLIKALSYGARRLGRAVADTRPTHSELVRSILDNPCAGRVREQLGIPETRVLDALK